MKLCFVTTGTFSENSMMKRALRLAPHLRDHQVQPQIVAVDTTENRQLIEASDFTQSRLVRDDGVIAEVISKARHISQLKPDAVYICGMAAKNTIIGDNFITLVEHAELASAVKSHPPIRRMKARVLEWCSICMCDGLVLASSYLDKVYGARLQKLPISANTIHLPYGYDPPPDRRGCDTISLTGDPTVLYFGTVSESYGIFDLIEAAVEVKERYDTVGFEIVGSGPAQDAAENYTHELGLSDTITFRGFIKEDKVPTYLAGADLFVAPMRDTVQDWARCPSKIPLYMSFKKPIVTCQIGEVKNYLGNQAYYYAPEDVESMADAVIRALRGAQTIEYDLEKISWERLTKQFLNWLDARFGDW